MAQLQKKKNQNTLPEIVSLSRFIGLPTKDSPRFLAAKFNYVEKSRAEKSVSSPTENQR